MSNQIEILGGLKTQHKASEIIFNDFLEFSTLLNEGDKTEVLSQIKTFLLSINLGDRKDLTLIESINLSSILHKYIISFPKDKLDKLEISTIDSIGNYLSSLLTILTDKFDGDIKEHSTVVKSRAALSRDILKAELPLTGDSELDDVLKGITPVSKTASQPPAKKNLLDVVNSVAPAPATSGEAGEGGKVDGAEIEAEVDTSLPMTLDEQAQVGEVKKLLEQDKTWLDWTAISPLNIQDGLREAESLNEYQLVDKITGVWVPFDTEPDDWDKFFEEHKIAKEQQENFKKYFKRIYEGQDFGSAGLLGISDQGEEIDNEARRLLEQPTGPYEVTIGDLGPNGKPVPFPNKKDALLFLYHNKLIAKEVGRLFWDAWIGAAGSAVGGGLKYAIMEKPEQTMTILLYTIMGIAIAGIIANSGREVRDYYINSWRKGNSPRFHSISTSSSAAFAGAAPADPKESKVFNESKQRKELQENMEKLFKGNDSILDEIKKVVDKHQNVWTNSYYIKMYSILHGKNPYYRYVFKPILMSKEGFENEVTSLLKNKEKLQEVFHNGSGETTLTSQLKEYMELSHSVLNGAEAERTHEVKLFLDDIKDGKIPSRYLIQENWIREDNARKFEKGKLMLLSDFVSILRGESTYNDIMKKGKSGKSYSLKQISEFADEGRKLGELDIKKNPELLKVERYKTFIDVQSRMSTGYNIANVTTNLSNYLSSVGRDNRVDVNATIHEIITNQTEWKRAIEIVRNKKWTMIEPQFKDVESNKTVENKLLEQYLRKVNSMTSAERLAEKQALKDSGIIKEKGGALELSSEWSRVSINESGTEVRFNNVFNVSIAPAPASAAPASAAPASAPAESLETLSQEKARLTAELASAITAESTAQGELSTAKGELSAAQAGTENPIYKANKIKKANEKVSLAQQKTNTAQAEVVRLTDELKQIDDKIDSVKKEYENKRTELKESTPRAQQFREYLTTTLPSTNPNFIKYFEYSPGKFEVLISLGKTGNIGILNIDINSSMFEGDPSTSERSKVDSLKNILNRIQSIKEFNNLIKNSSFTEQTARNLKFDKYIGELKSFTTTYPDIGTELDKLTKPTTLQEWKNRLSDIERLLETETKGQIRRIALIQGGVEIETRNFRMSITETPQKVSDIMKELEKFNEKLEKFKVESGRAKDTLRAELETQIKEVERIYGTKAKASAGESLPERMRELIKHAK